MYYTLQISIPKLKTRKNERKTKIQIHKYLNNKFKAFYECCCFQE